MYFYKNEKCYACSEYPISNMTEITKQEYDEFIASLEPTEEEMRAEKERLLRSLLAELYPAEEV